MVREEATRASDRARDPGCDGLMNRKGTGGAVVGAGGGRGRGWVWFAVLAVSFISLTITIPIAFALSLASGNFVLMVGTMTLLVEVTVAVAVAVEAAAGVQRLAIHSVGQLEASAKVSVLSYDEDMRLVAERGQG